MVAIHGLYVINPCSPRGTPNEKHAYAGLAGYQPTFFRNLQEFREATGSNKDQGVHNLIRTFGTVRVRLVFDTGLPPEPTEENRPSRNTLHEAEREMFLKLASEGVTLWNQKLDGKIKAINTKNIEALLSEG